MRRKKYQIGKLDEVLMLDRYSVEPEPADESYGGSFDTISLQDIIDKINELVDVVNDL